MSFIQLLKPKECLICKNTDQIMNHLWNTKQIINKIKFVHVTTLFSPNGQWRTNLRAVAELLLVKQKLLYKEVYIFNNICLYVIVTEKTAKVVNSLRRIYFRIIEIFFELHTEQDVEYLKCCKHLFSDYFFLDLLRLGPKTYIAWVLKSSSFEPEMIQSQVPWGQQIFHDLSCLPHQWIKFAKCHCSQALKGKVNRKEKKYIFLSMKHLCEKWACDEYLGGIRFIWLFRYNYCVSIYVFSSIVISMHIIVPSNK